MIAVSVVGLAVGGTAQSSRDASPGASVTAPPLLEAVRWPTRYLDARVDREAEVLTHLQAVTSGTKTVHPLMAGDTSVGYVLIALVSTPGEPRFADVYVVRARPDGKLTSVIAPIQDPYGQELLGVGMRVRGGQSVLVALAGPTVFLEAGSNSDFKPMPQRGGIALAEDVAAIRIHGRDVHTGREKLADVTWVDFSS